MIISVYCDVIQLIWNIVMSLIFDGNTVCPIHMYLYVIHLCMYIFFTESLVESWVPLDGFGTPFVFGFFNDES